MRKCFIKGQNRNYNCIYARANPCLIRSKPLIFREKNTKNTNMSR